MRTGTAWLIAIIAPLLFAACESSWNYYWSVENLGARPLHVVTGWDRRKSYGRDDTAHIWRHDTVAPHSRKVVAEYWQMNGGPQTSRPFSIAIRRGDALILHQNPAWEEEDSLWSSTSKQTGITYKYDVNFTLSVADTGIVAPQADDK